MFGNCCAIIFYFILLIASHAALGQNLTDLEKAEIVDEILTQCLQEESRQDSLFYGMTNRPEGCSVASGTSRSDLLARMDSPVC